MKALLAILTGLCLSTLLHSQTLMMGIGAGIGASKLEPRPTSPYLQYERFPAVAFGTQLEYLTKGSTISPKLGFWIEIGGEEGHPLGTMTFPLMVKATFGKKWRPYLQGGIAGCYVFERSRRYQTSDFSSIYGGGMELALESGTWLFAEYVHLAGISSVFDQLMNVTGSSETLVENHHLRQYLKFGAMFYLGGNPHYIKNRLRTE